MKKLLLALVLVAVVCLGFSVSANLGTSAAAPLADVTADAAPVCSTAEILPFGAPLGLPFTPTYCGDPCSVPGDVTGCIDLGTQPPRRTDCWCIGGSLAC